MADTQTAFSYLAAGLLDSVSGTSLHPLRDASPLLWMARNMLLGLFIAKKQKNLPLTDKDWIGLFEQCLGDWWPGPLPGGVDSHQLIWVDGYPADWLAEYLAERGVKPPDGQNSSLAWYFQSDLDQVEIRQLIDWCRARGENGEIVYTDVRQYLVEHPITTREQLKQWINDSDASAVRPLLDPNLISDFYEPPGPLHRHADKYWACPYCQGMLRWYEDLPRCVRHSICGQHYPEYTGCQAIPDQDDLLVLKLGIHWRVCIPGIPELDLYEQLETLRKQGQLRAVNLWPGADRYDIRIVFNNTQVWAIDIKDYSNPRDARNYIKSHGKIYKLPPWEWHKSYYVIPDYRASTPGYMEIARPKNYRTYVDGIVGIKKFMQYVKGKIKEG